MLRPTSRLVFVLHGARADRPEVRHLVGWVRDKGIEVVPRVTWESGDATRFAQEAVRDGATAVVAVGGDGTVNEVVNGLAGSRVPLGVIPVGTANDFARQMGIPEDPNHAMDIILRQPAREMDVGEVNGRVFLNVSTGGVGAETTAETSPAAKERLGALAYALTGMKKLGGLRPRRGYFSGPGFEFRGEWLLFAVGNGRITGGGTAITPHASVRDGLLDLCVIEAVPRAEFARLTLLIRKGEHLGHPAVRYAQLPELTVESSRAMAVNVDGEPVNARRLRYRAIPGGLMVHLPAVVEPAELASMSEA
jgi:lipid kinase YegS